MMALLFTDRRTESNYSDRINGVIVNITKEVRNLDKKISDLL